MAVRGGRRGGGRVHHHHGGDQPHRCDAGTGGRRGRAGLPSGGAGGGGDRSEVRGWAGRQTGAVQVDLASQPHLLSPAGRLRGAGAAAGGPAVRAEDLQPAGEGRRHLDLPGQHRERQGRGDGHSSRH